MPSFIYQNVINLTVRLSMRRSPSVFMKVPMRKQCTLGNYISWCCKFYYSNRIIINNFTKILIPDCWFESTKTISSCDTSKTDGIHVLIPGNSHPTCLPSLLSSAGACTFRRIVSHQRLPVKRLYSLYYWPDFLVYKKTIPKWWLLFLFPLTNIKQTAGPLPHLSHVTNFTPAKYNLYFSKWFLIVFSDLNCTDSQRSTFQISCPLPRSFQRICRCPSLCVISLTYYNFKMRFCKSFHPTPKMGGHPLSAVRDCLFSIFAATVRSWRPTLPSGNLKRSMPLWQGPI
jgi:hypothetical protein